MHKTQTNQVLKLDFSWRNVGINRFHYEFRTQRIEIRQFELLKSIFDKKRKNRKMHQTQTNQVPVNKVRPSGPCFKAFPFDLEGSLIINPQGGQGGEGVFINRR